MIGNAASVATIVETVLAANSTASIVSLVVWLLLGLLNQTGVQQRFDAELWSAAKLAAKFEIQWPVLIWRDRLRRSDGHVHRVRARCDFRGCYRIVWLDVSPTVWKLLLAQLASQIVGAAIRAVGALRRPSAVQHCVARHLPPRICVCLRRRSLRSSARFLTWPCRHFVPNASHWQV
jgi:hypothetical protein